MGAGGQQGDSLQRKNRFDKAKLLIVKVELGPPAWQFKVLQWDHVQKLFSPELLDVKLFTEQKRDSLNLVNTRGRTDSTF